MLGLNLEPVKQYRPGKNEEKETGRLHDLRMQIQWNSSPPVQLLRRNQPDVECQKDRCPEEEKEIRSPDTRIVAENTEVQFDQQRCFKAIEQQFLTNIKQSSALLAVDQVADRHRRRESEAEIGKKKVADPHVSRPAPCGDQEHLNHQSNYQQAILDSVHLEKKARGGEAVSRNRREKYKGRTANRRRTKCGALQQSGTRQKREKSSQ